MHAITMQFEFDAAHRLVGHKGKCKNLHGHRYVTKLHITRDTKDSFSNEELNSEGMVVDFGDVKSTIGKWINDYWDHNILLNSLDPLLVALKRLEENVKGSHVLVDSVWAGAEPYIFLNKNPTAENMCAELFIMAKILLSYPAKCELVQIFETPNCSAFYDEGITRNEQPACGEENPKS